MPFYIKFTRQSFENGEACRAIQHVFSKRNQIRELGILFISLQFGSLYKLVITTKDANLVFYLSVYKLVHSINL